MNKIMIVAMTLALGVAFVGCEQKQEATPAEKAKTAATQSAAAVKQAAAKTAEATKQAAAKTAEATKAAAAKTAEAAKQATK